MSVHDRISNEAATREVLIGEVEVEVREEQNPFYVTATHVGSLRNSPQVDVFVLWSDRIIVVQWHDCKILHATPEVVQSRAFRTLPC